jgi:hypothetical protein
LVYPGQYGTGPFVQEIIPFLGAGVSLSARQDEQHHDQQTFLKNPQVEQAVDLLGLTGNAERFLETAAEVALLIQEVQNPASSGVTVPLLRRLVEAPYPPSAAELVQLLSEQSSYRARYSDLVGRLTAKLGKQGDEGFQVQALELLRLVATIVGIPSASLSSISAYYEAVTPRTRLLVLLSSIFANKNTPSPTHRLLAEFARWHLRTDDRGHDPAVGHYLIVTTNYDCLMELALKDANLPFVVLTMDLQDFKVHARFAGSLSLEQIEEYRGRNPDRYPNFFTLDLPSTDGHDLEDASSIESLTPRLVILYKIHGCLYNESNLTSKRDSIIISDNDYVLSISRMSAIEGIIPACVSDIWRDKPFLFLGYSLSDWNVRGILKAVHQKRGGEDKDYGDYTVVRSLTLADEAFFNQNQIRILQTTLAQFSETLGHVHAPQGFRIP